MKKKAFFKVFEEFLDLYVSLYNGKLYKNLHIKATDCCQYLKNTSPQPDHTKKSIVYGQALCLTRLCSFEENSECNQSNMRSWFLKRK